MGGTFSFVSGRLGAAVQALRTDLPRVQVDFLLQLLQRPFRADLQGKRTEKQLKKTYAPPDSVEGCARGEGW